MQISVIIVSYNVKDFIVPAITSLKRALSSFEYEIFVVDNASRDDSVQAVRSNFPEVTVIENRENVGFARANNQAIQKARGEFVLLINPDTLVQEDVFSYLFDFMKKHPKAGAATCQILNEDGSFSIDTRHSVPTPATAFWKTIGFDRLFPKHKMFGRYNLTFLDTEKTYEVDAISGSFMFIRKKAIEQIGMLDEDYFMYCEDVDYCYRLNRNGWKVYYAHDSYILHYKGESSKSDYFKYIKNFSRSLKLFYQKHFSKNYNFIFHKIIDAGIAARAFLLYSKFLLKSEIFILSDLLTINFTALIISILYYGISGPVFYILSIVYFVLTVLNRILNPSAKFKIVAIINLAVSLALAFFLSVDLSRPAEEYILISIAIFAALILQRMVIEKLKTSRSKKKKLAWCKNNTVLSKIAAAMPGFEIQAIYSMNKSDMPEKFKQITAPESESGVAELVKSNKINTICFIASDLEYKYIFKKMRELRKYNLKFEIISTPR